MQVRLPIARVARPMMQRKEIERPIFDMAPRRRFTDAAPNAGNAGASAAAAGASAAAAGGAPPVAGQRERGTVKWFDSSKGYGFISRASGGDIFVHFTGIKGSGYRSLEEGQAVEYVIGTGIKGPAAQEVSQI
jgi:CspA family cold shock protein